MSVVAVSGLAGISPLSPYSDRPLTVTSPNERMRNGDWNPTQVLVASLAQSKWRIRHRFPKHRSDRGRIPANRHEYSVPRPLTPMNHGPSNIWRVCDYAGDPQKSLPSNHRIQGGPRSETQTPDGCLRPEGTDRAVRWDIPAKHAQYLEGDKMQQGQKAGLRAKFRALTRPSNMEETRCPLTPPATGSGQA